MENATQQKGNGENPGKRQGNQPPGSAQGMEGKSGESNSMFDRLQKSDIRERILKNDLLQSQTRSKGNIEKLKKKELEVDQLHKELETYTFIASHDLQEPLRSIQMIASVLVAREAPKLSTQGRAMLKKLSASAGKLRAMIQDLVEYTTTGQYAFRREKTDLNQIVAEVVLALKPQIREKKAQVKIGKLPTVKGVPFQLHKLFLELLTNSLKFAGTKSDPVISVHARRIKNTPALLADQRCKTIWHISVSDNGPGFPPEFNEEIFNVFRKLNGKHHSGSGIGLATCKRIVESHGGVINAAGLEHDGTVIDILLPCRKKKTTK